MSEKGHSRREDARSSSGEESTRDDISIPPIGIEDAFFDGPFCAEASLAIDTRDPVAARKLTPAAAKRRAYLTKYVIVAVGLAATLCAAALVKGTAARGHQAAPGRRILGGHVAAAPAGANTSQTARPVDVVSDRQGLVTSSAPELIAAATPDEKHAGGPDTAPSARAVSTPDPKLAAKEKVKSQAALEWGKVNDSIAAGVRSIELDPSDAEAWLILGAAYQQKGDSRNAIRCFKACLDQGKRGPRNECALMLR